MCNCKGTIQKDEMDRTIWTNYDGGQINGWKHIKCGKRMSDYQLMYKTPEEDGRTRSQREFGHE